MGHPDQSEWEAEAKEMEWYDGLKESEISSTVEAYFGTGSAPVAGQDVSAATNSALSVAPLLRFSVYTEIQKRAVIKAGHDVLESLDRGRDQNGVLDGAHIEDAYGRFFLWLCAAFEIGRTMRDAKKCFSPRLRDEIIELMIPLEELRVPFAKQQMPAKGKVGRDVALQTECSIVGFGASEPDLQFQVNDSMLSARALIEAFEKIFISIEPVDVLHSLRTTLKPPIVR